MNGPVSATVPSVAREVEFGSVRPCDECGRWVAFDNPDADVRVCASCRWAAVGEDGP